MLVSINIKWLIIRYVVVVGKRSVWLSNTVDVKRLERMRISAICVIIIIIIIIIIKYNSQLIKGGFILAK